MTLHSDNVLSISDALALQTLNLYGDANYGENLVICLVNKHQPEQQAKKHIIS